MSESERSPAYVGRSWHKYFQYQEGRDPPSEARNVLLIISGLIAAVTFQAGVNPPGGVWQDNDNGHVAGTAIYASQKVPFLCGNLGCYYGNGRYLWFCNFCCYAWAFCAFPLCDACRCRAMAAKAFASVVLKFQSKALIPENVRLESDFRVEEQISIGEE